MKVMYIYMNCFPYYIILCADKYIYNRNVVVVAYLSLTTSTAILAHRSITNIR